MKRNLDFVDLCLYYGTLQPERSVEMTFDEIKADEPETNNSRLKAHVESICIDDVYYEGSDGKLERVDYEPATALSQTEDEKERQKKLKEHLDRLVELCCVQDSYNAHQSDWEYYSEQLLKMCTIVSEDAQGYCKNTRISVPRRRRKQARTVQNKGGDDSPGSGGDGDGNGNGNVSIANRKIAPIPRKTTNYTQICFLGYKSKSVAQSEKFVLNCAGITMSFCINTLSTTAKMSFDFFVVCCIFVCVIAGIPHGNF